MKAFLKAGILGEDGVERDTITGTPQGGILSPLLANIALSVLDEHFAEAWEAMGTVAAHGSSADARGWPTTASIRYADDFVVMVAGTRAHAESLREEVAAVLRPDGPAPLGGEDEDRPHRRGLRLPRLAHPAAPEARHGQGATIYTYPSKAALAAVKAKVRTADPAGERTNRSPSCCTGSTRCCGAGPTTSATGCPRRPSATCAPSSGDGWSAGCATSTRRRRGSELRRRYLAGWWPTEGEVTLFNPARVHVTRYRYRGDRIPSPWTWAERMQPTDV